jgi:hypothetical protein
MKQAAKGDADQALHKVGSKTGAVLGSTAGSESTVAQHPKSLVGGAAAGGFMLGLLGGSDDERRSARDFEYRAYEARYNGSNGHSGSNGNGSNGQKSGLIGSTLGKTGVVQMLSETMRDVMHIQAGVLLDTALDTAKSVGKTAAGWDGGEERSAAERQDPQATDDWRDVEAPRTTARVPRAPVSTI